MKKVDKDFTGLFVAIGHLPRSELVAKQVELNSEGYVQVEGRSTKTKIPGVFACGDLVDLHLPPGYYCSRLRLSGSFGRRAVSIWSLILDFKSRISR